MFDPIAEQYDAWYDTPKGQALFATELECLRPLVEHMGEARLEIGVGTGRFAEALGISHGVDPAPKPLELAASRGINTSCAAGEQLPYADGKFDGVLIAFTLCFVNDPEQVLREVNRVLRANGELVLGIIPRGSPLGDEYTRRGQEGHPIYSAASFLSIPKTEELLAACGFQVLDHRSTLFASPQEDQDPVDPSTPMESRDGVVPGAGFVAFYAKKQQLVAADATELCDHHSR
jgi:ubiquinone/menaquinone biosynthesis C-methylase UbiE